MNLLEKGNHTLKKLFPDPADTFFGRPIEDILASNFFDSFDANMLEFGDSYRLDIGVPGLTRKDVTIDIDGRVLSVTARRKAGNQSGRPLGISQHRRRSFMLPPDADINNIHAKCLHGLLTIRVNKINARGTHRVIPVSGKQSGPTVQERVTSGWTRLLDRAGRFLNKKRA